MKAINRKLLRDLGTMRGQVLAICLVMACGVATFVMSLSMLESLQGTQVAYYDAHRFAEVFAHVKRAPNRVAVRIADIPGIAQVQTRIVERVTLDMPDLAEPASGRIISLPADRSAGLNLLYLRSGRWIEPGKRHEVLMSEAFAVAHGLHPGDSVAAVLNGRLQELRIAGIVLSPEYVYQIREGDLLPDERRFGVFWMHRDEIEAAFDMKGAFNDLVLTLMPQVSEEEVILRLDDLLEEYGGLGAYGREDQLSHKFVTNEIRELRGMTLITPVIFLGVAAFLFNIVFSRLVAVQREQIAALKALGYSRFAIGLHYLKFALLIAGLSVVLGTIAGAWMGSGLTRLYATFFHFPVFSYHLRPVIVVLALFVACGAGILGSLRAVGRAVRLSPAQAMRPQPPASFRPTFFERLGFQRLLSQGARIILRQIERRPGRAALSCTGIALAASVLVVGSYSEDAVEYAIDLQFFTVQRYDISVGFAEASDSRALEALEHLPGVRYAEPFRTLPARIRSGHRSRRLGIMGLSTNDGLMRLMDVHERLIDLPREGLIISDKLAEVLGVKVGDAVIVEVLEGRRPTAEVPVADVIADFAGLSVYMHVDAANRLMREGHVISGAFLSAEQGQIDALYGELKETPLVATVNVKSAALQSFRETLAESLLLMKTFLVIFAVILAFGVIYNSARISLSEKQRDLATLRVIGFTHGEISMIQLGELAVLTTVALPVGLALGYGLAALTSNAFETELFRIPLIVNRSTFAFAAVVVLIAVFVSGMIVRRMLNRLDLIAVLKMRE